SLLNCTQEYSVRHTGDDLTTQCSEMVGLSAGLLTGIASSLVTTWAGKTPATRGRTIPSLAVGAASAITGYLLFLKGENLRSDAHSTAGLVMLSIGTPLVLTL